MRVWVLDSEVASWLFTDVVFFAALYFYTYMGVCGCTLFCPLFLNDEMGCEQKSCAIQVINC
jgi:hypothetical protein